MMTMDRIFVLIGAAIACLLQVVIAPQISIAQVMPNFLVIWALLVAVTRARVGNIVLPFVLGLLFDLMTGGPLGAMAFCLTLFAVASSALFVAIDNDTLFVSLTALAVGILLVELSYGIGMLLLGYEASFVDALVYRIVPCFIYDTIIAFALFPLSSHVVSMFSEATAGHVRLR